MKITDLMDQFYDESVALTPVAVPDADAVLALTRNKLGRKPKVYMKAILIAAMIAAFGITVGAVGYSLYKAARMDLGISDAQSIPEYTEYPQADRTVEGASITLVSALCSGERVTAYLSVSPVTLEMAEIADQPDAQPVWSIGKIAEAKGAALDYLSSTSRQVEYDPQTCTALVRFELVTPVFQQTDTFTMGVMWENTEGDRIVDRTYFGTVTIPITPAEAVRFHPDLPFANRYLDGAAVLSDIEVLADHIVCEVEYPSFEEYCARRGEDAWQYIGDAYWGYHHRMNGTEASDAYNELAARVAYQRSWAASFPPVLEDAVLTLTDGTELRLDGLSNMLSDSGQTYCFTLQAPISLAQVQSMTVAGKTYLANQGE